jgi:hypothetical protein
MVAVKTARDVTTRVSLLPAILTSPGSKSGTPFYLNRRKRVNTILKLFGHQTRFCPPLPVATRVNARGTVAGAASGRRFPTTTDYLHRPITRNFRQREFRSWEEALDAVSPLARFWAWALVAALLLLWGWQLAWQSPSEWQWAPASVYLLPPQQRCRPDPNHKRCLEGPRIRIESN